MGRSIFGWDLPPGCTNRDIERAFGGGDLPPCCEDCEVDPCDNPEACEKYQKASEDQQDIPEDGYPH